MADPITVSENRRRIRDLTDDILRTIGLIAELSQSHEDCFQAPELLNALGNLKRDMLYVYSVTCRISPSARNHGLRGFGSQFKAWMKRDEIEREIRRLREHVNNCYLQFTAFSAARIEYTSRRVEHTSLRVEQALVVNHVENHVRLQRLETMMARILLQTQFGQNIMNRTIEIISSDPTHRTIEFQYLSIQTLHVVDGLQELLLGIEVDLPWDTAPLALGLEESPSPTHILHRVLGMVLAIRTTPTEIQAESIMSILDDLGATLEGFRMSTEAIAWGLLRIKILRQSDRDRSAGVFPRLSHSLQQVSEQYAYQLRHDLALQFSQNSVHLSQFSFESWPHPGNQTFLVNSLISHSRNLRQAGELTAAISAAEAAVAMACSMAARILLESCRGSRLSPTNLWIAVADSTALFVLAAAFSSARQPREAYEASKQSLQKMLRFCGTIPRISRFQEDIDSFFHHMCTMAEAEDLSVEMLADCVILFRDLARIYPEEFSLRFVRVLYAYVCIGQWAATWGIGPAMQALRILLEPESDLQLPMLPDFTHIMLHLSDFDSHGGVHEDALRGFLVDNPTPQVSRFIGEIFVANWDVAMVVLRATITTPYCDVSKILFHILGILAFTSDARRSELLSIVYDIISLPFEREEERPMALVASSRCFWLIGSLDDAVTLCQEGSESGDDPEGRLLCLVWKVVALHDMGQIATAMQAAKKARTMWEGTLDNDDPTFLWYCTIHFSILRRTRRYKEALQIVLAGIQHYERAISDDGTEDSDLPQLLYCGLLLGLSAARQSLGQNQEALQDAELAVIISRQKPMDDMISVQMCSLTRSLVTLSSCLASVGRDREALAAAQEAEIACKSYLAHRSALMLVLIPERPQEVGASVYSSLALRLATLDQLEEALSSAETATRLYRELVSLARRFLPDLASSLQNLARILWKLDCQVKAIVVCDEAVSIMCQVASEELYFLPTLRDSLDQLAEYLGETGNVAAASTAVTESAEVQRKFSLLPAEIRDPLGASEIAQDGFHADHAQLASTLLLRNSESLASESVEPLNSPGENQDIGRLNPEPDPAGCRIQNTPDTLTDFRRHKREHTRTRTDIAYLESQSRSTPICIFWVSIGILSIAMAWMSFQTCWCALVELDWYTYPKLEKLSSGAFYESS
ncbi:hypothetical protein C8R44DRAFT_846568 [Mycena epipterygia]|nr:hypothetical protein C8R44DRAFT_846568 [Mycena epipterygia]